MLVWCSRAAAFASRSNRRTCLGSSSDAGREHLQRHPPAQRLLLGLVDHAHAAAADLAEDAVVAQPLEPGARSPRRPQRPASRSCRRSSRPGLPSSRAPGTGRGSRRPARGSARRIRASVGCSPRRLRSRNSSARASTGLRSSLEVVIEAPLSQSSLSSVAQALSAGTPSIRSGLQACPRKCSLSPGMDDRISLSRFRARI